MTKPIPIPLTKQGRKRKIFLAELLTPYERHQEDVRCFDTNNERFEHRPVDKNHGGYGVVASGYIAGPFMVYENAIRRCATLYQGRVVRWIDFVTESVRDPTFNKFLSALTEPLTLRVIAYGKPVSIHDKPKTAA